MKFQDFQQVTRSRYCPGPVESRIALEESALVLLSQLFPLRRAVRLLGVTLSSLGDRKPPEPPQLSLSLAL